MSNIVERLAQLKVVPVIAIQDAEKAVKLAEVLVDNGLPCAEITFRTPVAAAAIQKMRNAFPDMLIGAGTVLSQQQVDLAVESGANFVVSPGFNPLVVGYCLEKGVNIIPGVNNPSQVEQAMGMGLKTLKFFPAEPSGGIAMLKSLSAVYPVAFMPTGGVSPANAKDYLSLSSVFACGGTWMVPPSLIEEDRWEELGQLIREVKGVLS